MEIDTEVWKPIKGYEGLYEISSMGRVKTVEHVVTNPAVFGELSYRKVPERIRKPNIMKGYHCICLNRNGQIKVFRIHRLVAEAFIGEQPGPEYQINHKDGNKANNSFENLEWVTPRENTLHARRTGLIKPMSEERKRKFSQYLKKQWKDKEYRKMQSDHMHSVWDNAERRKKRTEAITNGIHTSESKRYLRNRGGMPNAGE